MNVDCESTLSDDDYKTVRALMRLAVTVAPVDVYGYPRDVKHSVIQRLEQLPPSCYENFITYAVWAVEAVDFDSAMVLVYGVIEELVADGYYLATDPVYKTIACFVAAAKARPELWVRFADARPRDPCHHVDTYYMREIVKNV